MWPYLETTVLRSRVTARGIPRALWLAVLSAALVACGGRPGDVEQTTQPQFADVSDQRLIQAQTEPSQWLTYGGTYDEQRYSRLEQITKENVSRLGLVWYADYDTNLQQEATPLFVDGVIYVSTAWSKLYAVET